MAENCDIDGNNWLSKSERNKVEILDIGYSIKSAKGIEYFPNLRSLICSESYLRELDVSKNKNLQGLSCYDNQLTSLDLTKNKELSAEVFIHFFNPLICEIF